MENENANSPEITCISLCTGYEGLGMGIKGVIPNMRTVLYSEIEKYACEVLVERMEKEEIDAAPIWTNLKTLPCEQFSGKVDILHGGFPCPPFSAAGKRKGTEDPRHLWPFIEKAIVAIQPGTCFFENVEGLISSKTIDHLPQLKEYCEGASLRLGEEWGSHLRRFMQKHFGVSVLQYVLSRLEAMGYSPTAGIFSAAEVGAPHQRKRVYIMAHRNCAGLKEQWWGKSGKTEQRPTEYTRWPARPGQQQFSWEEPRTV